MRRTFVLVLSLAFGLVVALQAQLPANLDCKCTATGDGEYLCKCVPSKGSPETLAKGLVKRTGISTTSTPFVLPEPPLPMTNQTPTATSVTANASTAAKGTETPTGTSTSKGQPIYTGPRGNTLHLMILMAAEMSLSGERL
jgi:hypothetical protein